MFTPYDWQESIGHRAQYVESRLASGAPVLAVSLQEGILAFTVRRQARKIFEIYDRLMFSAIGQQSDVESMRSAAIDFAHQEGYQRSEQDVTIQRVVGTLSQPLKKAFGDFSMSPLVMRCLFMEVCRTPADDTYCVMDYDGDYTIRKNYAYLAGAPEAVDVIKPALAELDLSKMKPEKAIEKLRPIWAKAMDPSGEKDFAKLTENLEPEAALMERDPKGEFRFKLLTPSA